MAPKWRLLTLTVIFMLPIGVMLTHEDVATAPNSVELICDIDSVASPLVNNNIVIPVYLTNITDSVAGFTLWLNFSDPRFLRFVLDSTVDTIKYAKFDTTGTLSRGWQFFQARVLDDSSTLLKIVGKADEPGPPLKKPIPPGSGMLVKFFARTNGSLGDSLCDTFSVVIVQDRYQTSFSNQLSKTIGCNYEIVVDTFYFNCAQMIGDSCISWFDTVYDTIIHCVIDTTKRVLLDGAISFACCKCGDADGNGFVNISDAVAVINYIFIGVPVPGDCRYPFGKGDADGNGFVNISDAVALINYIFIGVPVPHCLSQ